MTSPDADLKSVFCEALDRPAGPERDAFLEDACRDKPELKAGVDELLAAHDQAGRFLAKGPKGPVADRLDTHAGTGTHAPSIATSAAETLANETHELARTSASETLDFTANGSNATNSTNADSDQKSHARRFVPGQVIALRYTLRSLLGEGGLGTVYLAEQTEPVKRQVALKLIKLGMDSRAVLARFDAERQALALMDHPNIARVYDGGTTETGQPFFVMELVNGLPITHYCDQNRLPVRARLELFVAVCQAVQHAHQKGIIHRDLKPSNVMVTEVDGRPTPKVIDFGVAKATEFDLTDQSLGDTGAIVGTPTYMSPEQADPSTRDIDTRTDVYALGVILYELLAGSPPLDASQFKRGALLEMLRMVREVDPPRPSTKVSTAEGLPNIAAGRSIDPAQLKRALLGDLDWIVMKALEKDRTRRYETANGFAADINRHLSSEPVLAAPPSRLYRTKKFVRKNRGAVVAASLVLLSLFGGLAAVAAVQTAANASLAASLRRETRANTALNEANSQLTKSRAAVEARYTLATEAIKTFHTGVSEDFLLKEEKFKALRDRLLKSAGDFYEKLGALLKDASDLPSRRALLQANYELAQLANKVGRKEDTLALHRRVLAAREALAAEPGAGPEARGDVAISLVAIGQALEALGKTDEALKSFDRARATVSAGVGGPPPDAAGRSAFAEAEYSLGRLLGGIGRMAEGLRAQERARDVQKALADESPGDRETLASLARSHSGIGFLLGETGKPAEAMESFQSAHAIRKGLAEANPAFTQFQFALARSHNNIGILLRNTDKPAEALASFQSALAILKWLVEANPAVTEFQVLLSGAHNNIGVILMETGKPAEALASYRSALPIQRELAEANPAVTEFQFGVALTHNNIGLVLGQDKPAEALASFQAALAINRKLAEADASVTKFQFQMAVTHRHIGELLHQTGKHAEAMASYHAAVAIVRKLAEANPAVTEFQADLALNLIRIGQLLIETGKPAEAMASCHAAVAIYRKLAEAEPTGNEFQSYLALTHSAIGNLLSESGKAAEALASHRSALAIRRRLAQANPANPGCRNDLADSHTQAADALRRLGRQDEARADYEAAIAIREVLARESPTKPDYHYQAFPTRRLGLTRLADGDAPGAAADTRRALGFLNGMPTRDAHEWFETACCHATLSALASREGSGVPAADRPKEAELAIELLKKAIGLGYRNPGTYRLETALDALRDHENFQKLMAKLEAKTPADPGKQPE
jgi:serine/threonine protein kinase/tetratricopeptide (TPR) repeat protein